MKAAAVFALFVTGFAVAAEPAGRYVSLQQEMRQAIARGNAWLKSQQKEDGHWDDDGLPAFTALALTAAAQDSSAKDSSHVAKGYDWLL
jgi:squalene-hopene/tetraprenyl-beta-curcumene cyclase